MAGSLLVTLRIRFLGIRKDLCRFPPPIGLYEEDMVLKVKVSPELMPVTPTGGYGRVADVFRANLTSGQEVRAAVSVYRDGVEVVDLWGGFRHGITAPSVEDTLVPVLTTTKAVASFAVAVAASRGLISYDAKVADYWPAFARAKSAITMRQLLSHEATCPRLTHT